MYVIPDQSAIYTIETEAATQKHYFFLFFFIYDMRRDVCTFPVFREERNGLNERRFFSFVFLMFV